MLGNPGDDFVADFVGADRGLKRLKVTCIDLAELEQPPVAHLDDLALEDARAPLDCGTARSSPSSSTTIGRLRGYLTREPRVRRRDGRRPAAAARRVGARRTTTLKDAFGEMLLYDAGWVAVLDDDDRFLGVLTPIGLLETARADEPPD